MSWKIEKLSAMEWAAFSENMHKIVFKEIKPCSKERISYALLAVKDETVVGYVTAKEYDADTVYWQWGGILPQFRRSMTAVKCIEGFLEYQKRESKRIVTYVQNTNTPMLKFFLGYGFLIIGVRTYNEMVMVDLVKELRDGDEKHVLRHAKSKTHSSSQSFENRV